MPILAMLVCQLVCQSAPSFQTEISQKLEDGFPQLTDIHGA